MLELAWDDELELIAQAWANQCEFDHDVERSVERFRVGQNIFISWRSDNDPIDLNLAIDLWYDEVRYMDNSIVKRYRFDFATGHYTQMVWANTHKIGKIRFALTKFC